MPYDVNPAFTYKSAGFMTTPLLFDHTDSNSLSPGECEIDFECLVFKCIVVIIFMNDTEPYGW